MNNLATLPASQAMNPSLDEYLRGTSSRAALTMAANAKDLAARASLFVDS
jgi:hypothetical protein